MHAESRHEWRAGGSPLNPLLPQWQAERNRHADARVLVMVDTAMQHELGQALAENPAGALSLLPAELPADGQALGAWLLAEEQAKALGIDGSARGVNWIISKLVLKEAAEHLRRWVLMPLPDETPRGYVCIADGRSLSALLTVWNENQRAAFFSPWHAWCYADRDGKGVLVDIPLQAQAHLSKAADPQLDEVQYRRLLEASVADQLLHELKAYVQPHASLSSRQMRYLMAAAVIDRAKSEGYLQPQDWMTLIGWCLRVGVPEYKALFNQAALRESLQGSELWDALMKKEMT